MPYETGTVGKVAHWLYHRLHFDSGCGGLLCPFLYSQSGSLSRGGLPHAACEWQGGVYRWHVSRKISCAWKDLPERMTCPATSRSFFAGRGADGARFAGRIFLPADGAGTLTASARAGGVSILRTGC